MMDVLKLLIQLNVILLNTCTAVFSLWSSETKSYVRTDRALVQPDHFYNYSHSPNYTLQSKNTLPFNSLQNESHSFEGNQIYNINSLQPMPINKKDFFPTTLHNDEGNDTTENITIMLEMRTNKKTGGPQIIKEAIFSNDKHNFGATKPPTNFPSSSMKPSVVPTTISSLFPSLNPTSDSTAFPSIVPTETNSQLPTLEASSNPSTNPSIIPTIYESSFPTAFPSAYPNSFPTVFPSISPSEIPSQRPSVMPSWIPSNFPTPTISLDPSSFPSAYPSTYPSMLPTAFPSEKPSNIPSNSPTFISSSIPSTSPTLYPSLAPSISPSKSPSSTPSQIPSVTPSSFPSNIPTTIPSQPPSSIPTTFPSHYPTNTPSLPPSLRPTSQPSKYPSSMPTSRPSMLPSVYPSASPSSSPSQHPSALPSHQPSSTPSVLPSVSPSSFPSIFPSSSPSQYPSSRPSTMPSRSFMTSSSSEFELVVIRSRASDDEKGFDIYGDFLFMTTDLLLDSFKSSPEVDVEVKSVMLSIMGRNRKLMVLDEEEDEEKVVNKAPNDIQKVTMRADVDVYSDSALSVDVVNSVISSSFNGVKKGEYIFMLQSSSDDVLSSCTDVKFLFVNDIQKNMAGYSPNHSTKSGHNIVLVIIGVSCGLMVAGVAVFLKYFVKFAIEEQTSHDELRDSSNIVEDIYARSMDEKPIYVKDPDGSFNPNSRFSNLTLTHGDQERGGERSTSTVVENETCDTSYFPNRVLEDFRSLDVDNNISDSRRKSKSRKSKGGSRHRSFNMSEEMDSKRSISSRYRSNSERTTSVERRSKRSVSEN